MRLHCQTRAFLLKPPAAVTIMELNKIHRAVIFIGPIILLQTAHRHIHQNHAARSQDRLHPPVTQTDTPVSMMPIVAVEDFF
jgi:hypothetical protein